MGRRGTVRQEQPEVAQEGLGEAAARGAAVTLIAQLLQVVLQVASVIILARLLVPADFGLVGMVTAVIGVAYILQDFGLSMAAIQSPTLSDGEQTNLFWANVVLGVCCCALAVGSAPLIVGIYREPRLTPIIFALAAVFAINGVTAQYKVRIARYLRFRTLAIIDLSAQALSIAVAVVLAASGMGFWSIVIQQLVYSIANCILSAAVTRWMPGLPMRGANIRRFLRFGAGVVGAQAISFATRNVDNIAIGAFWGATSLGFYTRAFQLMVTPINKIDGPMTRVALPILARVQADNRRFSHYLERAQVVSCYVTASVLAIMAGLSYPIVRTVFGERWLSVAPIFAILAAAGVFHTIGQIAYWAYLARGATDQLLRQRIVTGLLTVVLIIAGTPWGPVGVAIGYSMSACALWLISMIHAGRSAKIDSATLLRSALKIIAFVSVPCGVGGWLASALPLPPPFQILTGLGIDAVYVALACAAIPSMRADVRFGWSFARRSMETRIAEHS